MKGTGCRRLLALIRGLPEDAAIWRQDKPRWTQEHELAAATVEALNHWLPILAAQWAAKGTKFPAPQRIFTHPDRPAERQSRVTEDPDQIRSWFARHMH